MVYICPGTICPSNGVLFSSASISRVMIDDDLLSLSQTRLIKVKWTPSHLIRLLDNCSALVNRIDVESSQSLQLWNNQFKLTRKLQSYLNTVPKIMDIDIYNDQLLFIYSTLEIQIYSLATHSWTAFPSLPLYAFIFSNLLTV